MKCAMIVVSVLSSLVLAVPATAQEKIKSTRVVPVQKGTPPQGVKQDVKKVQPQGIKKAVAKVDLNKADAKTIAKTLGVDQKVADAVVAHRTKNGMFKTTDDVLAVPGLSRDVVGKHFHSLGLAKGKIAIDVKPLEAATKKIEGEAGKATKEATKKVEGATKKAEKAAEKAGTEAGKGLEKARKGLEKTDKKPIKK